MIKRLLYLTSRILRADPSLVTVQARADLVRLILPVMVFGSIYGAVMGSYNGINAERLVHMLYAAVKVPILLTVAFAISLPSFFVLNTLVGLRDDLGYCLRSLIATQAGLTIILASLAPFTALWYLSFENYNVAILFNMAMFATASISSRIILRRYYTPLIQRDPRHKKMLNAWIFTYGFVAVQMAWVLRPFIGNPESPISFFRQQAWSNAYVKLYEIMCNILQ
ncbi:MAG: hypothetical protein JEZ07_20125 [Phycisphaerae bacterium]|nr:hypothetical protein [Phycisphaerae bacterium]